MSRALIKVYSGKLVDIANPESAQVDISDIAHSLANLGRWTGHAESQISVGQHSIIGSILAEIIYPDVKWLPHAFALHDAAEAYVGDMSSPLKALFPEFAALENRWHRKIEDTFMVALGTQWEKVVDNRMMATENGYYMTPSDDWVPSQPAFEFEEFLSAVRSNAVLRHMEKPEEFWMWMWEPWNPDYTEEMFMQRLRKLRII